MNKKRFKIAISQINPITGDIAGNSKKILAGLEQATNEKADFFIVSPLALSGLNLKEYAFNSDFMNNLQQTVNHIAQKSSITTIMTIPNGAGFQTLILEKGVVKPFEKLPFDLNFSISPYGKESQFTEAGIYIKALGGFEDEVYTGGTTIINPDKTRTYQMSFFEEDFAILDFETRIDGCFCLDSNNFPIYENEEFMWSSLTLALKDYVTKSGFKKVILGMSGGMDSAFVAALAVDALGQENVYGVSLPSHYTSDTSKRLAKKQCEQLNIKFDTIPITNAFDAFEKEFSPFFSDYKPDVTEENLQARIRGVILMSLSNKFGHLLLSTGNKSEGAVGYCTLYGDTCGGFNPIKDLYKTEIYRLAKWRNNNKPELAMGDVKNVLLEDIITRPPTAELRDNQQDSDSLPDYPILDSILAEMIENGKAPSQLYSYFNQDIVDKVYNLLRTSQFKRNQSVVGTSMSRKPLSDFILPNAKYNFAN